MGKQARHSIFLPWKCISNILFLLPSQIGAFLSEVPSLVFFCRRHLPGLLGTPPLLHHRHWSPPSNQRAAENGIQILLPLKPPGGFILPAFQIESRVFKGACGMAVSQLLSLPQPTSTSADSSHLCIRLLGDPSLASL